MSDQTSSIFNDQNTPTQAPNVPTGTPAQSNGDLANLLGSIKNERGEQKYKTVEDALVGLQNSQTYIPELKNQLAEREAELRTAREAAARVEEMQRSIEALTQQNEVKPNQPSGFSADQIAELVNQTLTKKQTEDTYKANIVSVVNAMQTTLGTEAEKVYNAKAIELGMSVAQLNSLSASNPKAVLTLLGISGSAPKPQAVNAPATFNTSSFTPTQDSFIGRNATPTLIGATTDDLHSESLKARKMVEELHAQGKSISDLTNPKVYFKTFK